MLSTNAFNYVNVLDKAADASWKRETVLANNIANVNTPGYKRKDLDFESTLKEIIRIVWMEAMWILTLKKLSMLLNSFGMRGLRQESTMSLVA